MRITLKSTDAALVIGENLELRLYLPDQKDEETVVEQSFLAGAIGCLIHDKKFLAYVTKRIMDKMKKASDGQV